MSSVRKYIVLQGSSEIQPERQLSGPVAALPRCLRRVQDTERCWATEVRCGRSKVRVIQGIGKSGFKSHLDALPDGKDLRQSRGDANCSGALQYTYARISDSSGARWGRRKRVDVPQDVAAPNIRISDPVGPRSYAAPSYDVGVGLIQCGANGGREPRTGLYQCDRSKSTPPKPRLQAETGSTTRGRDQTVTHTCQSTRTVVSACRQHFRERLGDRIGRRKV
jgi:hypothetical protein